jgi:hypothetical protein
MPYGMMTLDTPAVMIPLSLARKNLSSITGSVLVASLKVMRLRLRSDHERNILVRGMLHQQVCTTVPMTANHLRFIRNPLRW